MENNPILKFSIEQLLFIMNPKGKPYFKKTHFIKMIYLLNKRLLSKDIDIQLPFYWYLHGDYLHDGSITIATGHPLSYYLTKGESTRKISKVPDYGINVSIREKIINEIINLRNDYCNGTIFKKGYIYLLFDAVYQDAPYKFQIIYRREFCIFLDQFRTPVRHQIPSKILFSEEDITTINSYLDKLTIEYPDDFKEFYEIFLVWEDSVRLALEYDQNRVFQLVVRYWKFFSSYLRIIQNQNIDQSFINDWIDDFYSNSLPIFKEWLSEERNSLLLNRERKREHLEDDIILRKIMNIAYDEATSR